MSISTQASEEGIVPPGMSPVYVAPVDAHAASIALGSVSHQHLAAPPTADPAE